MSLHAIKGMGLAEISRSGLVKKAMWVRLGARYHGGMNPGERICAWCKEAHHIREFATVKEGKASTVCVYCKARVGEYNAIQAAKKKARRNRSTTGR